MQFRYYYQKAFAALALDEEALYVAKLLFAGMATFGLLQLLLFVNPKQRSDWKKEVTLFTICDRRASHFFRNYPYCRWGSV